MHRLVIAILSIHLITSCVATSSEPSAGTSAATGSAGTTALCYDGVGVRPSAEPTPLPSVQALWDQWQEDLAAYQAAAGVYSTQARAHADAFAAAAGTVPGRSCRSDLDCDTHDSEFIGHCRLYYQVGQCEVIDTAPLPTGPQAPPQPTLTCANFSCSANFQCEQEASTLGIACVLQRCASGGSGGGHGGH